MRLAVSHLRLAAVCLLAAIGRFTALIPIHAQPAASPTAAVWYVDAGVASTTHTGVTWAAAFDKLEDAIAAANAGDQIFVAEGTYKPPVAAQTTGFLITKSLKIYGGFKGPHPPGSIAELSPDQRLGSFQLTILDGDKAGDDPASYTDNMRHVVSIETVPGTGGNPGVVIDGFRIAHGYALGIWKGGGIWSHMSDVDVANCYFDHDYAYDGGGIWFVGGVAGQDPVAPPKLLHMKSCEFFDNHADHAGGALFGERFAGWDVNTKFINNRSVLGGAAYIWKMSDKFNFTNCVFWENYCLPQPASMGGALYLDQDPSLAALAGRSDVANCTFSGNFLSWPPCVDGQAVFVSANSVANIYNSILWWNHDLENLACTGSAPISGPAVVEYSDVEWVWTGTGSHNISSNPLFTAGSPPTSNFAATGGTPATAVLPLLTLRKSSATAHLSDCIDHADYGRLPLDFGDLDEDGITAETLPIDLLESGRFVDRHGLGEDPNQGAPAGGIDYTDMGAYERPQ